MSIPEKVYRIAKGRLAELRDRLDALDAETAERLNSRADAHAELAESLRPPDLPRSVEQPLLASSQRERTADARPLPGTRSTETPLPGTLAYHLRMLGLPRDADMAAATVAYRRLLEKANPALFPDDPVSSSKAQEIRTKIENSYKAIREELDATVKRFDRLEFDTPSKKPSLSW